MTTMRVSIREILALVAIVALAIPLYMSTSENSILRSENEALRNEAGLLNIFDEAQVNLIAIPSASLYSQAWRISLPKNSDHIFQLVFAQSKIPCGSSDPFPDPKTSPSMAFTIPANDTEELILRIELKVDPTKIAWSIDGLTGSEFETDSRNAVWTQTMPEFTVHAKNSTLSAPLGDRIELFTAIRRWDDKTKTWLNKKSADGVKMFLRSFPDLSKKH